jgi:hypothetical protein
MLHLHLTYLVTKHPFDFVAHGFATGGAEMDRHSIGGFPNFLYKRGMFVSPHRKMGRAVGGEDIVSGFVSHGQLLSRKKKPSSME